MPLVLLLSQHTLLTFVDEWRRLRREECENVAGIILSSRSHCGRPINLACSASVGARLWDVGHVTIRTRGIRTNSKRAWPSYVRRDIAHVQWNTVDGPAFRERV